MKKLHFISLLATTMVLTACGGGGGSDDPADKYVGTWLSKCHAYTANSGVGYFRKSLRVLTKVSPTELSTTYSQPGFYSDAACTNSLGTTVYTYNPGKYVLGKATTFLGAAADEMVYTDAGTGNSSPGFMTASGNQWSLVTYTAGAALPAGWSTTSPYTRQ